MNLAFFLKYADYGYGCYKDNNNDNCFNLANYH